MDKDAGKCKSGSFQKKGNMEMKRKIICKSQKNSNKTMGLTSRFLTVIWVVLLFAGFLPEVCNANTTIISVGASWKYMDNGSNQGTAWRGIAFDDTAWQSGTAELGYGDGDEASVVSFGPDSSNKYITTYFRHSFNIIDASIFLGLTGGILRDDGAVVYLNGTEIYRTNMPAGNIAYSTAASSTIFGAGERVFNQFCVSPEFLVNGTNVLAVEIHQVSASSSDISFNFGLIEQTSFDASNVIRGPYLQMVTPTSVVVKWRTDVCTDSKVNYGSNPNDMSVEVIDNSLNTEHEVSTTGLTPSNKYYYSIGTTAVTLPNNSEEDFFIASPTPGTSKPTRIWVIGDSGTGNSNAFAVYNGYLSFTGTRKPDVWLMLGDNAYTVGSDNEYQAAVFDMYTMLLKNTAVWPTFGNHDGLSASSISQTGVYFDIFTLPKFAEAGGLASNTEGYYSFNYANVHFISLDSYENDRTPAGPMLTWLQNDLDATNQGWIIAYWHHSPYTKGSHDSDDVNDSNWRMVDMRENVLPILEAGGVDLVLSGHSHSYERSFLIDGHYGFSNTFTNAMKIDSGNGRQSDTGVYYKPSPQQGSHEGTVYAVAGTSGKVSGGPLNHPAMYVSLNILGSMVVDVDGDQLDARFVNDSGAVLDHFTIVKGRPDCSIGLNQANYVDGDTITIDTLRITNPGLGSVSVEWKMWFKTPSAPTISYVNIGADGSITLPASFAQDFGPMELSSVTADMQRGSYEIGSRLINPLTGKLLAEDISKFTIQ